MKKGKNCCNFIFIFEKSISVIFVSNCLVIFLKYSTFFLILRSPKAPLKLPTKRRNGMAGADGQAHPGAKATATSWAPDSEHWPMADPPLAKQV